MSTEPESPAADDPPSSRADEQVRALVRAGDHAAFTALYRAQVSAVFGFALQLTGDRSVAEDVTAETFAVAWRKRAELEVDDRPLRPWLLGIAARQSLNATRSRRRRLAFLARRTAPGMVEDFADEVAARLDDTQVLARTQEALAALSRLEAEVVGLCVWAGLSYAEAAQELGVPIGTVRSRLARARARLREVVAAEEPPSPRRAARPPRPATHPVPEGRP